MKFSVQYTFDDLYVAQKLHHASSKKRFIWYFVSMYIFFLAILAQFSVYSWILIFFGVVFWFYPLTFLRFMSYRSFRQAHELHLLTDVQLTEKGMEAKNKLSSTVASWKVFIKAKHNEKVLLLYRTPQLINFFPKRVFADQEWKKLLEMVSKNIT